MEWMMLAASILAVAAVMYPQRANGIAQGLVSAPRAVTERAEAGLGRARIWPRRQLREVVNEAIVIRDRQGKRVWAGFAAIGALVFVVFLVFFATVDLVTFGLTLEAMGLAPSGAIHQLPKVELLLPLALVTSLIFQGVIVLDILGVTHLVPWHNLTPDERRLLLRLTLGLVVLGLMAGGMATWWRMGNMAAAALESPETVAVTEAGAPAAAGGPPWWLPQAVGLTLTALLFISALEAGYGLAVLPAYAWAVVLVLLVGLADAAWFAAALLKDVVAGVTEAMAQGVGLAMAGPRGMWNAMATTDWLRGPVVRPISGAVEAAAPAVAGPVDGDFGHDGRGRPGQGSQVVFVPAWDAGSVNRPGSEQSVVWEEGPGGAGPRQEAASLTDGSGGPEIRFTVRGDLGLEMDVDAPADATVAEVMGAVQEEGTGLEKTGAGVVMRCVRTGRILAHEEELGLAGVRDGDTLELMPRPKARLGNGAAPAR